MALDYCIESKINHVYTIYTRQDKPGSGYTELVFTKIVSVYKSMEDSSGDIVALSEKMIENYSDLIENYNTNNIYKFLGSYYYSTGQYTKSLGMYDQFLKKITNNSYYSFSNELLKSLLSCIAIRNLNLCKNKLAEYCDSYSFACSNIYKFVISIITSIDRSDIDQFKNSINHYKKYITFIDDDFIALDEISKLYFI